MRTAIFQHNGNGLTPAQRLVKLTTTLQQQSQDLIVCPELFLSGYNAGDDLLNCAESYDGPMATQLSELAKSSNTAIVYGYPERDGDLLYNSANCFSGNGELLTTHRKLCLPPGFEADFFQPGNKITVFELNGMRCGILICYDAEFPESVRTLAASGAQLIIVPTALGDQWGSVAKQLMPTRAFENGVWLMYANHSGVENGSRYFGGSCIIAPDGSDAARANESETVISAKVDSQSVLIAQTRLPYLTQYLNIPGRLPQTS